MAQVTRRALLYGAAVLYTVYTLGPLLWLAVQSFRPTAQIVENPFGLPSALYLGNYDALNGSDFWTYYKNSLVVVLGGLVGIALAATPMGYALARYDFRGRRLLFWLIFGSIFLPPALVIIPLFQELQAYGLLDNHAGLAVVYVAFALPMSVYILRAFFAKIPREIDDAARVDGANEWQLFSKVMVPLARPAIISVLLLWLVFLFNEYVLSLVLLQTNDNRTLPVGLTLLNSEYSANVGALSAALVMSAFPILVVFTLFAERFIRGMAAGAIKG